MQSSPIRRVAIIGAGTIGASWTALFLSRGLAVTASDPSPAARDLIRRMIERNLEIFKPRVVIVDYIANLTPDKKSDRPDIEIGEMPVFVSTLVT